MKPLSNELVGPIGLALIKAEKLAQESRQNQVFSNPPIERKAMSTPKGGHQNRLSFAARLALGNYLVANYTQSGLRGQAFVDAAKAATGIETLTVNSVNYCLNELGIPLNKPEPKPKERRDIRTKINADVILNLQKRLAAIEDYLNMYDMNAPKGDRMEEAH